MKHNEDYLDMKSMAIHGLVVIAFAGVCQLMSMPELGEACLAATLGICCFYMLWASKKYRASKANTIASYLRLKKNFTELGEAVDGLQKAVADLAAACKRPVKSA